jgi:periplasmic protein TonB
MSYTDTPQGQNRGATIATVAVIHVALGYALISGFGATVITEVGKTIKTTFIPKVETIKLDPLPPMEAEPSPAPKAAAPEPRLTLDRPSSIDTAVLDVPLEPSVFAGIGDIPLPPLPQPPAPKPAYEPKAAVPRGDPGAWVTTDDYPSRELRMGHEGLTRFRLDIGADGRVTGCTVTASSGYPGLDEAACIFVSRRARFDAATGADGAKTAGRYENAIRWQIPR